MGVLAKSKSWGLFLLVVVVVKVWRQIGKRLHGKVGEIESELFEQV